MSKVSKRLKSAKELFSKDKVYALKDALSIVKKAATAKFDESVDIAVNLGIDTRKSDQTIRGAVKLPHGTGKDVRVAVFTQGENAEIAKKEGASIVGLDDLASEVKKGQINFDVVIATPDAMRVVGQLGTILGPRGLMPNPKVGTVTTNVADAIQNVKSGIQFRADKGGVVHTTIGRASFSEDKLADNFAVILDALVKAKPASSKGQYVKKITVSSTMGIGVLVDLSSVNK